MERLAGLHLPLVILGEALIPMEPPESPLHDPLLRQDLEALGLLVALDDLDLPTKGWTGASTTSTSFPCVQSTALLVSDAS